jgi:hypothetical protein
MYVERKEHEENRFQFSKRLQKRVEIDKEEERNGHSQRTQSHREFN